MKVSVSKGSLSQVLQKIQAITERKSGMPIMSHALLHVTEENVLELLATDLELSIRTRVGATAILPGRTTVSARKLLEIVRELPADEVLLEEMPGHRMRIESGRARFQLSTIPAEDFPDMKFFDDLEFASSDVATIRKCFGKTLYGVPMEEDPFSVSGVYCHPVGEDLLRFVSSDGHRLAYYEVPQTLIPSLCVENGIVVPRKAVQEILKIIEKEEELAFALEGNRLILKTSDTTLSIQLLQAGFPEYQLIIPEARPCSFRVNRDHFFAALKRVAVLTNLKWRYVRFVISSGMLRLESENLELGSAADDLDIDYEGEDFSVAFNVRYVMEAIQPVESEHVRFEWVDSFHGGVFLDDEDPGYMGLIMPMVV